MKRTYRFAYKPGEKDLVERLPLVDQSEEPFPDNVSTMRNARKMVDLIYRNNKDLRDKEFEVRVKVVE
ncbi:hypothetical protein CMI37_12695 [Candidatus Pacearchaeota archaeon]|nr:hypothetical protein [Candidatus Pacearchaeota archaeon]|tara:strand:+ start:58 stop:261 length:204 start_codon:yes stop_codon:yes gene_type:complete